MPEAQEMEFKQLPCVSERPQLQQVTFGKKGSRQPGLGQRMSSERNVDRAWELFCKNCNRALN